MIIKIDRLKPDQCDFPAGEGLLRERLRFEELVADLSTRLVNDGPNQLDKAIADALKILLLFFKVNYCGLLEVVPSERQILVLNMASEKTPRSAFCGIDVVAIYPQAYDRAVGQAEPIIFLQAESDPPVKDADKRVWQTWKSLTVCMIPLHIDGQVTHCIGLWSEAGDWLWPPVYTDRVRLLGKIFARALNHGHSREALRTSENMLAETQRIAHVGGWTRDIASGNIHCSDEACRIFGIQPQGSGLNHEAFLALVHPQDRQAVRQAVDDSLRIPLEKSDIDCRLVRPDGSERTLKIRAETMFDTDGKAVRIIGSVRDITEHKQEKMILQKALQEPDRSEGRLKSGNIFLREESGLDEGFKNIVGISEPIRKIMVKIRQVAPMNTTVLLTGETGAGKGVFARMLHDSSKRSGKPFVHVNCAGLPANLIESELFGREKGAFTGATEKQIGRFELANGGTIFLDEIGELPIDLQAKLLKVIESGEFERLGSPRTVKVDARIIASTNRSLREQIKKSDFRRDLFYRLNVFPIKVPPLRERREDIPLFVKFFVDKFNKRCSKQVTEVPPETLDALQAYEWPGNVRELMNIIERSVIVSNGPALHLADHIDINMSGRWEDLPVHDAAETMNGLAEVERGHILETLLKTRWKIEGPRGSAHMLDLKPSTLRARMNKLHIKRPETA